MRKETINEFLKKAQVDWSIIERLIHENKLVEIQYKNKQYYVRKFKNSRLKKYNV